ncbi:MAG: 1-phosphofructokinase family hexose kinase [Clostridia bacterium]|nr:1-phosphofructokinase family hexose kinase [Clostridia bacterium]
MQYCLYINPTIDKTVEVSGFVPGETNRAQEVRLDAGGKAINVARVLKVLGGDPKVTGLVFRNDGDVIKNALEEHSIFFDFHEREGSARSNLKIVDTTSGQVTEINEPGHEVPDELLGRIADELVNIAFQGDAAVLSGRLPVNAPSDYYARLIGSLKEKQVRVYLDASGDAFREAVAKGPYLIKPNLSELEELTDRPLRTIGDVTAAAREIISRNGVKYVIVTFGSKGALAVNAEASAFAEGLDLKVGSTVGAGDAFVAGLIAREDASLVDMLKSGTAAAVGSVVLKGTQPCTPELYQEYLTKIVIDEGPDETVIIC